MPKSAYGLLSKVGFLRSNYAAKFLFVAFLGTHIPLIGICIWLVYSPEAMEPMQAVFMVLGFTVVAAVFTLFVLNRLLNPIKLSIHSLEEYYAERKIPDLPENFEDEAGKLMRNIQQTIEGLEGHIRTKEDLVSLLSHDLRSPFNAVIGILDLMEDESDLDTIKECHRLIHQESKKSLSFLERILTRLKQESRRIAESVNQTISIGSEIDEALAAQNPKIVQKELLIAKEYDQEIMFIGEKDNVSSIINNLISNAVKFSQQGGTIILTAENTNGEFKLRVTDRGIGFSSDQKAKLFDRFSSGEKGVEGESSTGFGLYSCRKLAEEMNGTLEGVSDGVNKGARFELRLPDARQ